jgi:hypothetical protein
MSEKIQFQTNVPVDVALKYSEGKDVTGNFGDQVLYTLTDGRVMFVPPIVQKQITDLGIEKGEVFTILKAEEKSGTRRTVKWLVTASNGRARSVAPPATSGKVISPSRSNEPDGAPSSANGYGRKPSSHTSETKGYLFTSQGQFLLHALMAAVDIAAAVERHAECCQIDLRFTSEDVRAIGLSIYSHAPR